MKHVKAICCPAAFECAEENHNFAGEVRESRQTNRSEYTESEGEPDKRHGSCQTAEFVQLQCARALAYFACEGKEQRYREPVGEHQYRGARHSQNAGGSDTEKDVSHVHHT